MPLKLNPIPNNICVEFDLTIEGCPFDGSLVDFNYTPAIEGNISGLPENCYPTEPAEVELVRVQLQVAEGVWAELNSEHFHLVQSEVENHSE